MAKATFLGDQELAGKLPEYRALYNRLKELVDADKVICPESRFHEWESVDPKLATASQGVLTKLSYGLEFRDPRDICMIQAVRAVREFLGLPPDGAEQWEDAFEDDPHEPVDYRTIHLGEGRAILTIPWPIDSSPPWPTQYMNDRNAELGKYALCNLAEQTEVQKAGVIEYLYGKQIDEESIGEAGKLRDYWCQLGAPREKLSEFLKSDYLRNCPFIDIHSTMQAAMGCCEPNRKPEEGDAFDTLIMATVLPYCDIVATSKDMQALLEQTKLVGQAVRYRASVYSAKRQDVQDFADRLVAL